MTFEYKVVPAPTRGKKAKGLKTQADRFANALEAAINDLAADGWEYVRTDTLPAEERQGLTGRTTVFQNMLVFRRVAGAAAAASEGDAAAVSDGAAGEVAAQVAETTERAHAPALPGAEKAETRLTDKLPRFGNPLRADREKDVAAE